MIYTLLLYFILPSAFESPVNYRPDFSTAECEIWGSLGKIKVSQGHSTSCYGKAGFPYFSCYDGVCNVEYIMDDRNRSNFKLLRKEINKLSISDKKSYKNALKEIYSIITKSKLDAILYLTKIDQWDSMLMALPALDRERLQNLKMN